MEHSRHPPPLAYLSLQQSEIRLPLLTIHLLNCSNPVYLYSSSRNVKLRRKQLYQLEYSAMYSFLCLQFYRPYSFPKFEVSTSPHLPPPTSLNEVVSYICIVVRLFCHILCSIRGHLLPHSSVLICIYSLLHLFVPSLT